MTSAFTLVSAFVTTSDDVIFGDRLSGGGEAKVRIVKLRCATTEMALAGFGSNRTRFVIAAGS